MSNYWRKDWFGSGYCFRKTGPWFTVFRNFFDHTKKFHLSNSSKYKSGSSSAALTRWEEVFWLLVFKFACKNWVLFPFKIEVEKFSKWVKRNFRKIKDGNCFSVHFFNFFVIDFSSITNQPRTWTKNFKVIAHYTTWTCFTEWSWNFAGRKCQSAPCVTNFKKIFAANFLH